MIYFLLLAILFLLFIAICMLTALLQTNKEVIALLSRDNNLYVKLNVYQNDKPLTNTEIIPN